MSSQLGNSNDIIDQCISTSSPLSFLVFPLQRDSSGSLVIKVEPCHQEAAGLTEIYLRAHFDFNPRKDRLIPSQDAGLGFRRGDILMVLNQEDSFWWQVNTNYTIIQILDWGVGC